VIALRKPVRLSEDHALSRAGVHKREHDALPAVASGHGIVEKLSDWMWGLLKYESAFRQPPPSLSSTFS
jgi:hypothetical protein